MVTTKMEKKMEFTWISNRLISMANFQQKHWIIYLILARLSVAWYSLILTYWGTDLKLLTANNNFTPLGLFFTLTLAIVVLLFEIANKHKQTLDKNSWEAKGYQLLSNLREETDNICKIKFTTLLNAIDSIKTNNQNAFSAVISDPSKQLDEIAKRMASSLRYLLQEEGSSLLIDDLYVSIAYQFPLESDEWFWATEEHGLSFEDLLTPQISSFDQMEMVSTFKHLLSARGRSIFYNSKADAEKDHKYIVDDFDERSSDGKLLGSIACYEDFIKKSDKKYIHYVLTISTYSRPFTTNLQEVENIKYNMNTHFISLFSIRIRIELCLLYLQKLGILYQIPRL